MTQRGGREDPWSRPSHGDPGQRYVDPAYGAHPSREQPADPTRELPRYDPYGSGPYTDAYGGATPSAAPYTDAYADPYGSAAYAGDPYPTGDYPPDPPPPGPPRWLWFVAGFAVLTVVGLVAALVIVNAAGNRQTSMEPLPSMPEPTMGTTAAPSPATTAPTTRSPSPTTTPASPTTPGPITVPPANTVGVVYEVSGTGRAMSITYTDAESITQTEFNVVLPWRTEVTLSARAVDWASVTVTNVGADITCSIIVDGTVIKQTTGSLVTICSPAF